MSIIEDVILKTKNAVQYIRTDKLKLHPNNPRFIKDRDFDILCESIQANPEFFEARPILCRPDMVVFAGNMRLRAAREIGMKEVPVVVMDITEEKARELMIRDNVQNGQWDTEALAGMFEMEELTAWGMPDFVFAEAGESQSEGENAGVLEAKEDDYEIPETIKTDIVRGDLFEIGPHRLLCGDSTKAEDVERLMGGEKADMVFTDPPYGVDYSGGIQFTDEGVKKEQRSRLENDHNERIYEDFLPLIPTITSGPVYTWFADTKAEGIYRIISKIGEIHALLIWVKNGGYGALNACYKQKHEPCLFWKPKGGKLNFVGDSTECTIWEIKKDGINEFHPTQKPVALAARAIGNHSGYIVADPSLGSGTTMVAAHQLNRKCYGMEIDEKYCQVIIDRMLRLDPALEVKRNGRSYNSGTKQA